jgi:hypothetical protein
MSTRSSPSKYPGDRGGRLVVLRTADFLRGRGNERTDEQVHRIGELAGHQDIPPPAAVKSPRAMDVGPRSVVRTMGFAEKVGRDPGRCDPVARGPLML